MIVIAHRGGNRVFPENSPAAVRHAFDLGADMAEIDVRLSRDGVPVVIHDEDLVRLFSIGKKVHESSAEELTALKYGHPNEAHLATFEQVLEQCRDFPLLLHVREESETILPIRDVVEKCRMSSKVVWGVVSPDAVRLLKEKGSDPKILAFIPSPEDILRFVAAEVDVIRLWDTWITEERIDLIHRRGVLVAAMTGRRGKDVGETSSERLLELKALGIDWVLVNDVQLAVRTLKAAQAS